MDVKLFIPVVNLLNSRSFEYVNNFFTPERLQKAAFVNLYLLAFFTCETTRIFRSSSDWSISGVPGISPPRDLAPPRGQIPMDLAPRGPNPSGSCPPCAPPFRDLAAPPPPTTQLENILVFRPSYQESFWNMVLQFIWQWICASQTRSQSCLIFSKVGVDFLFIVYVNIVLQLRAWFCCVFLILLNLSIVSWVSQINIYSLTEVVSWRKHIFTFWKVI